MIPILELLSEMLEALATYSHQTSALIWANLRCRACVKAYKSETLAVPFTMECITPMLSMNEILEASSMYSLKKTRNETHSQQFTHSNVGRPWDHQLIEGWWYIAYNPPTWNSC